MTEVPKGHLFLGETVDPATHERAGETIHYEASNLTTHGVIVGMTGSGKTGLGVVLLEEALMQGVPTLVIDPKGDMGNLLLSFPDLAPTSFAPWVETDAGEDVAAKAFETAEMWKNGLAGWGIGPERIAALHDTADFTIYTPGSQAGVPVNIIGSLRAPEKAMDAEVMADEVEGFASSLLGLVGVDADPLSSREHILLTNLISNAWSQGRDMDLATLITEIQAPPMRKLGVIDLDTFYPAKDRVALAMKINGLVASPAFASWVEGIPLDIESMLFQSNGKPRCAVVSIAHLSDEERQFVVTLLLSKLVTWMRGQSGTTDLRALVYMDEVFGFVPPTASPPAKKPILTILKQARAFGLGMVLSTQNPVDLDYKAISNAGTWMVGRLQTERDKGRLLEGMTSAGGSVDIGQIDNTISGLGKREFLLYSTKLNEPKVFGTRWAMSYLPGPLTRDQIGTLMEGRDKSGPVPVAAATGAASTADPAEGAGASAAAVADDEVTTMPKIADGTKVAYLDPSAPWTENVGAQSGGTRMQPAVMARCRLLYDDTKADLRHEAEWEAILYPLEGEQADMDNAMVVDYDERDLQRDAPDGARYVMTDAKIHTKTYFNNAGKALKDRLYRSETLTLLQNEDLKIFSRVDENREQFEARCAQAADDMADADAEKIRKSLETKIDRVKTAIEKAEDKVREVEHDAEGRAQDERMSGVIDVAGSVLGGLLGGRKSTRSILGGVRRAGSKKRMRQKAEERVKTAENRLTEKVDELEELEEELIDTLEDIQEDWEDKVANISEVEVPLEKTDISIDEIVLTWIPTN